MSVYTNGVSEKFPLPCPVAWCIDEPMDEEEYVQHQIDAHTPLLFDGYTSTIGHYDRI